MFVGTHLNADACAVLCAVGDLLELLDLSAACRETPDWCAAQWRADLAAAGLDPELTYPEKCAAFTMRTSAAALAASLHLSYAALATVARPDVRAAEEAAA